VKIVLSGLMMAALLWGMSNFVVNAMLTGTQMQKILGLGALVAGGGFGYFACLYAFGIFSLQLIKDLFPKRAKKATIVDIVGQ
jgi:hypothetical protein